MTRIISSLYVLHCLQVGGKILFATDDWFAVAENLLKVSISCQRRKCSSVMRQ